MSRNPVLNDKMENSQHAQPHRYELTHTPDTHVHLVYPVLYSFPKYSIPIIKHSHILKQLFRPNKGLIIAIKGSYPTMFLQ
jgi:hypothetical protein